MNLDPRQLETFATIVQEGSLSAAALRLKVTLAATSLRIKALEDRMGQRLLVRGKVARATPAGQALLAHIKQVRLLEADLANTLKPAGKGLQVLNVAVNADSLASWFLRGVQSALQKNKLLLHVVVDDQDHTLQWLQNGDVVGCVTTLATPLRGCVAEPLGVMRYRCVAAPALAASLCKGAKSLTPHRLLATPAIGFNTKDALQDQFLQQHLGLTQVNYPRHYLPAADAYHQALTGGMGWGMVATIQYAGDMQAGSLVDLFPGQLIDVPLYWQHWQREAPQAAKLSLAIKQAAAKALG